MTARPLTLRGPLAIIPGDKTRRELAADRLPGAGTADRLVAEIGDLARNGVLPARVDGTRLQVYTRYYRASLYCTKQGDGYRFGWVQRRSFADEEQLCRGALLLHWPQGTRHFSRVEDLPRLPSGELAYSAHWDDIQDAWRALGADHQRDVNRARLPTSHVAYLDVLTSVVTAAQTIEVSRQQNAPPLLYRSREPARDPRFSARGVYAFRLVRPASLPDGSWVYVDGDTDLTGRILDAGDGSVLVRFDRTVDFGRIREQGSLRLRPSDRVFRTQRDAIERVLEKRPELLTALLDRQLGPYRPDWNTQPRERLDTDQTVAFQSGLTVPDLYLVLGPPGTGKTRTIVQLAAECADRGQRILVTSRTHRAVDNVVARLPSGLGAVRVGNERGMTAEVRETWVDARAAQLREDVRTRTDGLASQLERVAGGDGILTRLHDYFTNELAGAHQSHAHAEQLAGAAGAAAATAVEPWTSRLATVASAVAATSTAARQAAIVVTTRRQRHATAERWAHRPVLGPVVRPWARRRQRQLAQAEQELDQRHTNAVQAQTVEHQMQAAANRAVAADPTVVRTRAAAEQARETSIRAREHACAAAARTAELLATVGMSLGPPPNDLASADRFGGVLGRAVPTVLARAELLREWRARIADADAELAREIVRYAPVVAATCIGTATTRLLDGVEFDLAIVDEAGQISTPDLLVPLVRARRAILVGDHHQLPPYLDEEVAQWAVDPVRAEEFPPALLPLVEAELKQSAFERLYPAVGTTNKRMLHVQRRMPTELAHFLSTAFYDGLLNTDHGGEPGDPLFSSPFAMVDTADQPMRQRRERRAGRRRTAAAGEPNGSAGYTNELEATLIATLVTGCAHRHRDWAVIVPYKAQVALVARKLSAFPGAPDNVGTVDAFQGGERDLIIFGFTRSNERGDVGFLRELRRLNVAMSRARRQLVLVGDSETLLSSRDRDLAALARSLLGHLTSIGDRRASLQVTADLR